MIGVYSEEWDTGSMRNEQLYRLRWREETAVEYESDVEMRSSKKYFCKIQLRVAIQVCFIGSEYLEYLRDDQLIRKKNTRKKQKKHKISSGPFVLYFRLLFVIINL